MACPEISHRHALNIIEWEYEPSEGRIGKRNGRKFLMAAGNPNTHSMGAPDSFLCGIQGHSQSQIDLSTQLLFGVWTLCELYEIARSMRSPLKSVKTLHPGVPFLAGEVRRSIYHRVEPYSSQRYFLSKHDYQFVTSAAQYSLKDLSMFCSPTT